MARIVRYNPSGLLRDVPVPSAEQRAIIKQLVNDLQILAINKPRALKAIARVAHDLARPILIRYATERIKRDAQ